MTTAGPTFEDIDVAEKNLVSAETRLDDTRFELLLTRAGAAVLFIVTVWQAS